MTSNSKGLLYECQNNPFYLNRWQWLRIRNEDTAKIPNGYRMKFLRSLDQMHFTVR